MAVVKDKKPTQQAKKSTNTNTSAVKTAKAQPVTPVKTEKIVKPSEPIKVANMAFGRENYLIMFAGILLIIIGFVVMASDKEEFGFGFMGLVLGPILVILGFITEFFAILRKPKTNS